MTSALQSPSPLPQIADKHRRDIILVYLGLRALFLVISLFVILIAPEQLTQNLSADGHRRLWAAWILFAGWSVPLALASCSGLRCNSLTVTDRLISVSLLPDSFAIFLAASATGGTGGGTYRSVYFLIAIHSYHFSPNRWAEEPGSRQGSLLRLSFGAALTVLCGMSIFCLLARPATSLVQYGAESVLQVLVATTFLLVRLSDWRRLQRLAQSQVDLGRAQQEQELIHARDTERRHFLRQLAHELATPLAALRNQIDFLEDVTHRGRHLRDSEEQFVYLREQTAFIQYLVSDIQYQFGKGAEIQSRYEFSKAVDLTRMIERIKKLLLPTARMDKQIDIKTGTSSMPSLYIDPHRMEQVVFNLLQNAVKYSRPGAGDIFLGYDVAEEKDPKGRVVARWHRISFENWGLGVQESDLPFIFDEYYRGTNIEGAPSGTGLGLAVAKRIVEAHGGRILVANLRDPTVFVVDLPEEVIRRPPDNANPAN